MTTHDINDPAPCDCGTDCAHDPFGACSAINNVVTLWAQSFGVFANMVARFVRRL